MFMNPDVVATAEEIRALIADKAAHPDVALISPKQVGTDGRPQKVFDEFPDLKIVLGHMGEGLPFWLDRIDTKMALFAKFKDPEPQLQKKPSEYFLENFYITTSGMNYEHPLMLAHEVVGPDRILFAVDYPAEDAAGPVDFMDRVPISDEDRRKIYHRNAERVFRL